MKIAIVYPPLKRENQYPLLGQNRQFRYSSSDKVKIFPIVPALTATILAEAGHEVLFLDGINRRLSSADFEARLKKFEPDLIAMETKAPIINRHWLYISRLKEILPQAKTLLFGDHVTFFPDESMECSLVDFVVTGGDYDYIISKLIDPLERGDTASYPGGVFYRQNGGKVCQNAPSVEHPELDAVPFIDRDLCRWKDYGEAYLKKPCAYIITGRGCGGRDKKAGCCTFCIWQHAYWRCLRRLRSPLNVVLEIEQIVKKYGVREIFDDNEGGALWDIEWMSEFAKLMEEKGLSKVVRISSNARADSLTPEICKLARRAGYRLFKVGLESGCDETLKRLRKMETADEIKKGVKVAKDHGLIVMLTTMVGYPWENDKSAKQTYDTARELMLYKTRFGDSLQSSIFTPYPGTPLYKEAVAEGWFLGDHKDYESLDMTRPVLKTNCDANYWCQRLWKVHTEPQFLLNSFLSLRSLDDLRMAFGGVISLFRHISDFGKKEEC